MIFQQLIKKRADTMEEEYIERTESLKLRDTLLFCTFCLFRQFQ